MLSYHYDFLPLNLTTATTYYFKYVVGDVSLVSAVGAMSILSVIFMVFYPKIVKTKGNGWAMRLGGSLAIAGYLIRIIGGSRLVTILIGSALTTMGLVPVTTMSAAYAIDCMDYGEYRTGIRLEGVIGALISCASKVGNGVASGLIGLITGAAGYDGSAAVQSESAIRSIHVVYNYIPLVFIVIFTVLACFYDIDKKMPEVRETLRKKHSTEGAV